MQRFPDFDPDDGGWLIAYGDDKAHDALAEKS
jgi:hypothetical protein